eukprot:1681036-Pleurochrysis_carterae.AAC.1
MPSLPSPPPSPPSRAAAELLTPSAAEFVHAMEMDFESARPCLDADAVLLHLDTEPVIRIDASGVWE